MGECASKSDAEVINVGSDKSSVLSGIRDTAGSPDHYQKLQSNEFVHLMPNIVFPPRNEANTGDSSSGQDHTPDTSPGTLCSNDVLGSETPPSSVHVDSEPSIAWMQRCDDHTVEPPPHGDDNCPVCLDPVKDELILPCAHRFCRPCIAQIKQLRCPLCKAAIDKAIMPATHECHSPGVPSDQQPLTESMLFQRLFNYIPVELAGIAIWTSMNDGARNRGDMNRTSAEFFDSIVYEVSS